MILKDAAQEPLETNTSAKWQLGLGGEAQSMQKDRRNTRFCSIISPRESQLLVSQNPFYFLLFFLWVWFVFWFFLFFSLCIMKLIYKEKYKKWNTSLHLKLLKNSVLHKGILGVEQKKTFHLSLPSKIKENQIFSFSLPLPKYLQFIFYLGWKLPKIQIIV